MLVNTHLDLIPSDAHSLSDQLFLHAVGVAYLAVDAVQHLQLVASVAEPFSLGRRADWGSA